MTSFETFSRDPTLSSVSPKEKMAAPMGAEDAFASFLKPIGDEFLQGKKIIESVVKEKRKRDAQACRVGHAEKEISAYKSREAEQVLEQAEKAAEEAKALEQGFQTQTADQEPVYHRVLFPPQEEDAGAVTQGTHLLLGEVCPAVLRVLTSLQSGAGDPAGDCELPADEAAEALLVQGWLQAHYLRQNACSADVSGALFQLLVSSPNLQVAGAAYQALTALIGEEPTGPSLGLVSDVPRSSPVYESQVRECKLSRFQTDTDFLAALKSLGYVTAQGAKCRAKKRMARAGEDGRPTPSPAGDTDDTGEAAQKPAGRVPDAQQHPRLATLQLVVRWLIATCHAEAKAAPPSGGPADGAETHKLFSALHQLRFDPVAQMLSPDLEMGMVAVLEVLDEGTWERNFACMVADACAVGNPTPSGRPHLEALRRVPPQSPRMVLLWQHAAAALLTRVTKSQVPSATSRRGTPQLLDVEAFLGASAWLKGDPLLAAKSAWKATVGARKRGAPAAGEDEPAAPSSGIAELKVAVEAADLLVWPLVRQGTISAEFMKRWHTFLGGLASLAGQAGDLDSKNLRNTITTMTTRNENERL